MAVVELEQGLEEIGAARKSAGFIGAHDPEWTERSGRHLVAIHEYVGRDDPRSARAALGRIREAAQHLTEAPLMGRPRRVEGTRELAILHTP